MDAFQELQEAIRLERAGKLEPAIRLYGKLWRLENRPQEGICIEAMWRLGISIFDERRLSLERALSQTKLTPTMEEGLLYLRDIPQSLSLLTEYFYDEAHDEIFRSNTIKAVGFLDDPRRIQFLADVLQHPSEKFRVRAIHAIDLDETDAVLKPLKKALNNSCLEVRFSTIHALFHRHQGSALAVALQQCPTREEKYQIIAMLGRLKFQPVTLLLQKFLQAQDREMICLSAEALAELEDHTALPLLKNLTRRFPKEGRIENAYILLFRHAYLNPR
ncbi:MAG: HEAT repeat domain-containing protein [Planctomycetota bacterium]